MPPSSSLSGDLKPSDARYWELRSTKFCFFVTFPTFIPISFILQIVSFITTTIRDWDKIGTEQKVGKLFISGIGAGTVLCVSMMVLTSFISKKRGYKRMRETRATPRKTWAATEPAILPLCPPIIIIGGIRLGWFSATEAGAVAIVYSAFLGILYKMLKLENCLAGLKETVTTTASIMLIVSAASVYSRVLIKEWNSLSAAATPSPAA